MDRTLDLAMATNLATAVNLTRNDGEAWLCCWMPFCTFWAACLRLTCRMDVRYDGWRGDLERKERRLIPISLSRKQRRQEE